MDSIVESYTDSDVEQLGHDVSSSFGYFPHPTEQTDLSDALQSNNLSRYETKIETFPTREPRARLRNKVASAIFTAHPCECEGDENNCDICKTLTATL